MDRPLPPTYFLSALVLAIALHFVLPAGRIIEWPWRWLGLPAVVFGCVLNLAADQSFKRRGTTVKPFRESTALVTGGVFRISRHPMYLGMVAIVAGAGLLLGSLAPLLVAAVLAVLLDRVFIRAEEPMLEATFGAGYREYRGRVRRWI